MHAMKQSKSMQWAPSKGKQIYASNYDLLFLDEWNKTKYFVRLIRVDGTASFNQTQIKPSKLCRNLE